MIIIPLRLPQRIRFFFLSGLGLLFLFIFIVQTGSHAEEQKSLYCVIHLHSDWSYRSQGFSLEEFTEYGKAKGADVVIFTDHALVRASYGFFPFRRTLQLTQNKTSVFKKGIGKYLAKIHSLQEKNPSILLIPAVEVAPFYYWTGSLLQGTLTLKDWHQHLLVIGIEDEKVLKGIPLISNPHYVAFQGKRLLFMVPGILCLALFWRLRRRAEAVFHRLAFLSLPFAFLFVVEAFPVGNPVNPYREDPRAESHQRVIDYVNAHGGMVFWAHPEVESASNVVLGGVRIETEPYGALLALTHEYRGFAALGRGRELVRQGAWDQLLQEYCQGIRKSPVWVISELDTLGALEHFRLKETVVWVKERSKTEVLRSLREGKMYASWDTRAGNNERVFLDAFYVMNEEGKRAEMGGEMTTRGTLRVGWRFRLTSPTYVPTVTLIRSGKRVATFPVADGEEVFFEDKIEGTVPQKIYYRLEIEEPPLLTNPIFVSIFPQGAFSEKR